MQRKHFILASMIFVCANGLAQQYPFIYYTPKDGLINSRVKSIKQDSRGNMYFITFGGLSVYDGARFTNYSQEEGLANEQVNDVIEIAPDSLLVATNAAKLNTLVKGRVGVFKTVDNFYPVINRFFKSKNGNWYVAADQGLFLFTGNRFVKIPLLNEKGNDIGIDIDRITEWKNLFLMTKWSIASKEKLILYDHIKRKVVATETKRNVNYTAVNSIGEIWITTDEGVGKMDTNEIKKGIIVYKKLSSDYQSISDLKYSMVFFDDENNQWFFNREGIYRISLDRDYQTIRYEQVLKAANLTSIYIDREGITWIGTDGNGVAKLINSGVELLNTLNENPARISAIFQEGNTIWLFNHTDNSIYRMGRNSVSIFPLPEHQSNIENIYSDNEKLYLASQDNILCIADKDNPASYKHPELIFTEKNSTIGNGVLDPYRNFIIQITEDDVSFSTYVVRKNKILFKHPAASMADQMALDGLGRLWQIMRDHKILVFTLHPDQPSQYLQLQKDFSKELPGLSPRSITVDKKNNVWVGTRSLGIYCLRMNGLEIDSVLHFTKKEGLTDNFIYTIREDNHGTVWAGTQTGLDKIFLRSGRYVIGNVSRNNDLFQLIQKLVIAKDNTVWALTNEGSIIKVSESTLRQPIVAPQLSITAMKINDSLYPVTEHIFLFNQNNFSFSVAAPSFIDEKSIRYSYLLEGDGNNIWSEASNQSVFNFVSLSPADYVLKVRCDFPEELYPPQTISYSFTITAPWWQTWRFRIIAIVLILGILFVAVRFYYIKKFEKEKAILEKQQAVEKERTRIATDMHDDLGAGLSRIKFLSETIGIKKQRNEPIEEDISKIRDYSHEMIGKMGEIVWALNEKNDSLNDLISYTRAYTVEYLSQNGIKSSIEQPDQFHVIFVSGEFRRNIFLIIKEVLHNVAKHSQAGHVKIKITMDQQLEICIHDDGIGFDRNNIRPFSNGLSNMEKRIKEIDGNLSIRNEEGTVVHISVPIPD